MTWKAWRSVVVAALCALPAAGAWAQAWPSKTIQLVVAYAPGGTGDVVARVMQGKLAEALGQSVVVENRAGASGAIGAQSVIRSPADGHVLLVGQTAEVAINQSLVPNLGYDPERDLQPVALASIVPLALVVPGNAPYANLADLLKASRAAPRGLSFASAGTGTPGHFAAELLKLRSQANLTHVPYKGAGPALNDLLGGHVDLYFSGFPAAMPHVKAGKLKLLALSSGKRSSASPETPTVAEAAGIRGFDLTLWQGFFAPRGTPPEVVARLNAEINKVLGLPEVRQRLLGEGAEVTPLAVEAFAAFVKAESAKYAQLIREAGVKGE